jgi:hypothetical protein
MKLKLLQKNDFPRWCFFHSLTPILRLKNRPKKNDIFIYIAKILRRWGLQNQSHNSVNKMWINVVDLISVSKFIFYLWKSFTKIGLLYIYANGQSLEY